MLLPLRTVMLVGAACLTVGWLVASTLSPPVANVQSLPERRSKQPEPVVEQPQFPRQLQLRMQQVRVAPASGRNPFVFGRRAPVTAASAPSGRVKSPEAPVLSPAEAVPVAPVLTLAGMGIDGDMPSAILSDGRDVYIVKAGERVGGYDVVEVTDSSVTLGDATGLRWVLRLR